MFNKFFQLQFPSSCAVHQDDNDIIMQFHLATDWILPFDFILQTASTSSLFGTPLRYTFMSTRLSIHLCLSFLFLISYLSSLTPPLSLPPSHSPTPLPFTFSSLKPSHPFSPFPPSLSPPSQPTSLPPSSLPSSHSHSSFLPRPSPHPHLPSPPIKSMSHSDSPTLPSPSNLGASNRTCGHSQRVHHRSHC